MNIFDSMHNCPHCNEPSISFWQKQCLGPIKRIRCSECGAGISVFWPAALVAVAWAGSIPVVALFIYIETNLLLAIAYVPVGFLIMSLYYHYVLPLRVRRLPGEY